MEANNWGFEPAVTQKASQDIVNQIRASILCGKLKPGDRLPAERKLTDIFGRSRPTIREALRMLEKDGLISIVGGSGGAVVCEPTTTQLKQPLEMMLAMNTVSVEELSEARIMAELSIVQWAAMRREDEDIAQLHRIIALEDETRDHLERFLQLDRDFHEVVAKAGKNRIGEILIQVLREPMLDTISIGFTRLEPKRLAMEQNILIDTHKKILRAISIQDSQQALQYMKEHIDQFQEINTVT